jgi:hypothetical protein
MSDAGLCCFGFSITGSGRTVRQCPMRETQPQARNEMRPYGISVEDVQAVIVARAVREVDERGNTRSACCTSPTMICRALAGVVGLYRGGRAWDARLILSGVRLSHQR